MGTSTTPESAIGNAKQLIATSTLKVYNVATGDEVTATSSMYAGVGGGNSRGVKVWNYSTGGARIAFVPATEQVIAAGETKTYELRGTILYAGKAGDSISTQIAKRASATSTGTFIALVAEAADALTASGYVTSTAPTFVWTDRSGAGTSGGHTFSTSDWSQEFKVSTFPTATLSLSK